MMTDELPGAKTDFDLFVIGTGQAGQAMARRARREGWRVGITDERAYGGTCGLRGCVPKKVLHTAAETVVRARHLEGSGIAGGCRIAWDELAQFKDEFTDPITARREATLERAGVILLHGPARFDGPNELVVEEQRVTARFIGIATGSMPRPLGIPGGDLVSTSDDFLAMDSLPRRILFIGGGYVSFELGFVAAAAGAEVTILQRGPRVLDRFDQFLVGLLVESCQDLGMRIETGVPVTGVAATESGLRVAADGRSFEADMVVHGAGRVPKIADLALEEGNVATDRGGIVVNEFLQSVTNPAVYVAGDVNSRGRQLSPAAHRDGRSVAENMIRGNTIAPDYSAVPSAIFAYPVLASVGLGVEAAEREGRPVTVRRANTRDWFTSRRLGIPRSGYVVLTDGQDGPILGAHLLGHNADEAINLFELAIRRWLSLADLQAMDWAFPSSIHDINRIR